MTASEPTRRDLRTSYKDQTIAAGIFAYSGPQACWVGYAPNLPAAENRLLFELRMGSHKNAGLAAAWAKADPQAFTFRVLEAQPDDLGPHGRDTWAKERRAHWIATLGAQRL